MKAHEIKDLFNIGETLQLNLSNCDYQLGLYIEKLAKVSNESIDEAGKKEKERFEHIFTYYKNTLIPALDEILELDEKHKSMMTENPDKNFTPIAIEFKNHKELLGQFFDRFEDLHREMYEFVRAHRN